MMVSCGLDSGRSQEDFRFLAWTIEWWLGNTRQGAVQFGTLEFDCLGEVQVVCWTDRSGTLEKLVGDTMYKLIYM